MENNDFAPDYFEQFVPLTTEEKDRLKKFRLAWTLIFLALSVFLDLFAYFFFVDQIQVPTIAIFAVPSFFVFIIGFTFWKNTREINFGQKKIIRGRIDEKIPDPATIIILPNTVSSSNNTYFYFIISGRKISVRGIDYDTFQAGDFIEIEMLPKSLNILKISNFQTDAAKSKVLKPVLVADGSLGNVTNIQALEISEMTSKDIKIVQIDILRRAFYTLIIVGLGSYMIFDLIFYLFRSITPISIQIELFKIEVAYLGRLWSVYLAIAIIGLMILYLRIYRLLHDLRKGKKNVIKAKISDKSRQGYFRYWISIGTNRIYYIPLELYNNIKIGQIVKLHLAPESYTYLNLEALPKSLGSDE